MPNSSAPARRERRIILCHLPTREHRTPGLGCDTTPAARYAELAPLVRSHGKPGTAFWIRRKRRRMDRRCYLPAYRMLPSRIPGADPPSPSGPRGARRALLPCGPLLRGAARQRADPAVRRPFLGFRCTLEASPVMQGTRRTRQNRLAHFLSDAVRRPRRSLRGRVFCAIVI